jgi:hypothetical protein
LGGWARRLAGLAGMSGLLGLDAGLSARVEKLLAKLAARSSGGQMDSRGGVGRQGRGCGLQASSQEREMRPG